MSKGYLLGGIIVGAVSLILINSNKDVRRFFDKGKNAVQNTVDNIKLKHN